jgi:hypothetical protein
MKYRNWIIVLALMATLLSGIGFVHAAEDFIPQEDFTQKTPPLSINDFTSQNINFGKMSRTYAKVKGEITNKSGKNLRYADFVIHVYDKAGNLINSASFTIRNFVNGSTRVFNTTIKAYTKNIASYKVEFKDSQEIPPTP